MKQTIIIIILFLGLINTGTKTINEDMDTKEFTLPVRQGEPPQIGQQPPQLQYSNQSPRDIYQKFYDWMFTNFPKVRKEPTRISVRSSTAMWLDENENVRHVDAFMPPVGGREFTHIHLDGSFHTVVGTEAEKEIIQKNWGVRHMYYNRGVKEMLVYAPRNKKELEIVKTIVVKSYEYATGLTFNN